MFYGLQDNTQMEKIQTEKQSMTERRSPERVPERVQLFLNAERNGTNISERNAERNERRFFAEREVNEPFRNLFR